MTLTMEFYLLQLSVSFVVFIVGSRVFDKLRTRSMPVGRTVLVEYYGVSLVLVLSTGVLSIYGHTF